MPFSIPCGSWWGETKLRQAEEIVERAPFSIPCGSWWGETHLLYEIEQFNVFAFQYPLRIVVG